jgi:hypothetical protein
MKEIVKNLESKDTQMQEKISEQDLLIASLLRQKNERTASADSNFALINQSPVAINGLPSSCGDLKMIGHSLNGFYSIVGSAMMESVYCDFSKLPSDAGKCFILVIHSIILIRCINNFCRKKVFKNGSDSTTSNQFPSIFTSSGMRISARLEFRFRSILLR